MQHPGVFGWLRFGQPGKPAFGPLHPQHSVEQRGQGRVDAAGAVVQQHGEPVGEGRSSGHNRPPSNRPSTRQRSLEKSRVIPAQSRQTGIPVASRPGSSRSLRQLEVHDLGARGGRAARCHGLRLSGDQLRGVTSRMSQSAARTRSENRSGSG